MNPIKERITSEGYQASIVEHTDGSFGLYVDQGDGDHCCWSLSDHYEDIEVEFFNVT